ncbi:MAG: nucleotidyltransferase domain-containing protein [Gemmatimonadetes bacterium]|nr:nucleotidyltransferase domain-containing protein [Gemmatimonadota bacterium]
MPVRSSNSRVLRWPDEDAVRRAALAWAAELARREPTLIRLGYFGSYANGTWGVGSDLDLVAVVTESSHPFERRANSWNVEVLPVPTDVLVYTSSEWSALSSHSARFAATLERETVWLVDRSND